MEMVKSSSYTAAGEV